MSLIKCPECGKDISDKAVSCPNCGNPINPQHPEEEYLCCPKCGSRELHAEKAGFSGGKALAGVLATGGIGLLAGTIGSRDTKITCLKCGNRFNAGEARVVKNIDTSSEDEAKAIDIIKNSGMLAAVKWYKDSHGCGLAEAKNYIDSIMAKHGLSSRAENTANGGQGCMVVLLIAIVSTISAIMLI